MNINETILFGCPIYKIKVDPTSYDKESLLKIIINNYSIDEYRNKFDNDKSSLHHSFLDDANNDFKKVDYNKIGLVKVYNEIFDDFKRIRREIERVKNTPFLVHTYFLLEKSWSARLGE